MNDYFKTSGDFESFKEANSTFINRCHATLMNNRGVYPLGASAFKATRLGRVETGERHFRWAT